MRIYFVALFFSLLGAQWFEGNLYLPDSFSGTCCTDAITWNSIDDKIYLRGFSETFVAIDCETDEKIQPIRINGNERSHPGWFEWNGGNNHLYIWCHPYRAFYDSLYIVDCQTQQTANIIPFPRNRFEAGNEAQMCASPISNKVYLTKDDFQAGHHFDTLIYVIDGNSHQLLRRIRFENFTVYHPDYPSLKWNPVNNCLYAIGRIPNSDTSGLAIIDCATDSIIAIIPFPYIFVGRNCFALDTLRNRLYFSLHDTIASSIFEINCFTNSIVQRIDINNAHDEIEFVLNPDARKIYYSNLSNGFVYIIDIISGSLEDSILVYSNAFNGLYLTFYPPNNEIYCLHKAMLPDSLAVVDLTTGLVSYYPLPDDYPDQIRPFLHPMRGKLYLNRGAGEAMVVFDCQTKTVRRTIYNGTQQVNDILLNPIEHKLYCTNNYRSYIFVFDSETNQAIRQVQVAPKGYGLVCFGFAPPHNKAYISYPRNIAVLDCRTDSVIKVISGLVSYYNFAYNPIVDKLYTLRVSMMNPGVTPINYVIDCATDSIVKILNGTESIGAEGDIEFDSLTNKVYMVGNNGGFVVIDCWRDSVIKRDTTIVRGDISFRVHGDRKVYAGKGMFDRFTDSLLGYLPIAFKRSEYNPILDQLYLSLYPSEENKIYVVDCRNHNVIDSILAGMPGFITGMFWNYLNNKLYFSPLDTHNWYEPVVVADCQTNEIVATFPQIDRSKIRYKSCLNPANNRFYVYAHRGSKLGMIRDNIHGIEEIKKKRGELKVYPTLGKRFFIEIKGLRGIKIYNAYGKKVAELLSDNTDRIIWDGKDMKRKKLSKGVYFITPILEGQNEKRIFRNSSLKLKKVILF
ncbi:MAG: YncE family protein [bacterium]